MKKNVQHISMKRITPDQQGTGAFDGGRITEVKPIGFPHESSTASRIGPLFYWAWATAKGYGKIGLHPHKGFEIISYVLKGEIGHRDTLGTVSRVKTGGAQVMQTGSGVSHEEETLGDHTEFFQIWFEPDLQEAVRREPTYLEFHQEDFPVETINGVTTKSVIGERGPISLVAPVTMQEVRVLERRQLVYKLQRGNSLAALVIGGEGTWMANEAKNSLSVRTGDLAVFEATADSDLVLQAEDSNPLRSVLIEVPTSVPYRLYA